MLILLSLLQGVYGRGRLVPIVTQRCDYGFITTYYFFVNNPNNFEVALEYGKDNFQIQYEDCYGLHLLNKNDIMWDCPSGDPIQCDADKADGLFRFRAGTEQIGSWTTHHHPVSIKFVIDDNNQTVDYCDMINLTSCSVVNNCDGTSTATFSYLNSQDYIIGMPFSPNGLYNFFTDSKELRIPATSQPTEFPATATGTFSINFTGTHITWHLAGRSLKATAGQATNVCAGGCTNTTVPMDDYYY